MLGVAKAIRGKQHLLRTVGLAGVGVHLDIASALMRRIDGGWQLRGDVPPPLLRDPSQSRGIRMSYGSQASFLRCLWPKACLRLSHGRHVRRRMLLGKRLHNDHGKTLLSLTTWVSLLTCVMCLRGATRCYTAVSRRPWLSIHTTRERTVHHTKPRQNFLSAGGELTRP